jgi:hypothetical protein
MRLGSVQPCAILALLLFAGLPPLKVLSQPNDDPRPIDWNMVGGNAFLGEIEFLGLAGLGTPSWGNKFNGYAFGLFSGMGLVSFIQQASSDQSWGSRRVLSLIATGIGTTALGGLSYYSFVLDKERRPAVRFSESYLAYSTMLITYLILNNSLADEAFHAM